MIDKRTPVKNRDDFKQVITKMYRYVLVSLSFLYLFTCQETQFKYSRFS